MLAPARLARVGLGPRWPSWCWWCGCAGCRGLVAGLGLLGMRAYDPVVAGFLAAPHRTY